MNGLLSVGMLLMALAWLMPGHFVPWTSFGSDAWLGVVLMCVSGAIFLKEPRRQPWPPVAWVGLALSGLPLVQLAFGQINFSGTAWLGSLYMLGLTLAVLAAVRWESVKPGELADALFLAIGFAALLSVGLQLCQWLNYSGGCLCSPDWVFFPLGSRRPGANLAQPNQLASLLVWGLIALLWAHERNTVRAGVAVVAAAFLLFGLALTESRTGLVAVLCICACMAGWRQFWRSRRSMVAVFVLLMFYAAVSLGLDFFNAAMQADHASLALERVKSEQRLEIWKMFIHAAWNHPWLGYGWDQTLAAQVADTTPLLTAPGARGVLYAQAHNLFLDLVIWTGLPLGLLLSGFIVRWVWSKLRRVGDSQQALLVLAVLTIGIHAMLELPLHYAYFLLPTGLLAGMLEARLPERPVPTRSIGGVMVLWLMAASLLGLCIRDYFRAEESYAELRLEHNRILSNVPRLAPDVVLLTQLRDFIVLDRMDLTQPLTQDTVAWIRRVTRLYPSMGAMLRLAAGLAVTGQQQEAATTLVRLCALSTQEECVAAKAWWQRLQAKDARLAGVPWPKDAV